MKASVISMESVQTGEVDLPEAIFGVKINRALLYEALKAQLASGRGGNAATRTRAFVSGTTAKMYRQKGTGRARHGDARAGIFVGGGKAFGPHPRDWSYRLPAKERRGAVRVVLSLKRQEGRLLIVEGFPLERIKTKEMAVRLARMGVASGLIVVEGRDDKLERSVRNLPNVKLIRFEGLNVHDLLTHEHTIMTRAALDRVQETLQP